MNRKQIEIETDFYRDQHLDIYKSELTEKSQLTAKSASSAVQIRKS